MIYATVAKLADAQDLGSCPERGGGSTPSCRIRILRKFRGRRVGLRIQWGNPWGFNSPSTHQNFWDVSIHKGSPPKRLADPQRCLAETPSRRNVIVLSFFLTSLAFSIANLFAQTPTVSRQDSHRWIAPVFGMMLGQKIFSVWQEFPELDRKKN